MGESCTRTFETLPRVEPGPARALRAGGRRGERQERQALWRHSLSLRAASEAATGRRAGGGFARRRAGAGGRRVARYREKRRPEGPRPGRLGGACRGGCGAGFQVGVGPRAEQDSELRAKVRSPQPQPGRPIRRAGGAGHRGGDRAFQLFLNPGYRQRPLDSPGSAAVRNPNLGERASRRQRLGPGAWASASGVFVRTRASHVCGLCGFGSMDVYLPAPLCVRGFAWLFRPCVHVVWARVCLWLLVGSWLCARVRVL